MTAGEERRLNAAAEEREVRPYRVYTNAEAADRIGSDVVRPSTLARLARKNAVPHTRNGRKVGWTDEQIAGAVAYLSTEREQRARERQAAKKKSTGQAAAAPSARARGEIAPLVIKPGSRYAQSTI